MSAGQAQARAGFGELLRQYRLACGLSQEELAERSGLAVRTIANMERGRTARPHRRSVRSLADALGLPEPQREQLDRASRLLAELDLETASELPESLVAGTARPPVVPRQLPGGGTALRRTGRRAPVLAAMLGQTAGRRESW